MRLTLKELQAIETEIVSEVSEICCRHNIDYFLHCGSALGAIRHKGPIPWDSDVDIIIPIDQFDKFLSVARNELSDKFYIDYYDTNKDYPTLFPRIGLKGYNTFSLHVDIFKLVGTSSDRKEQLWFSRKAKFYLQIFKLKTNLDIYFGKEVSPKMRLGKFITKPLLLFIPKRYIIKLFEKHCNKFPIRDVEYVTNPSGGYGIKNVQKKSIYGKGTMVSYSGLQVKVPEHYTEYLKHYYGDYMKLPHPGKRGNKEIYEITRL